MIIKIFLKTIFIAYCKMALHSLHLYLIHQVEKNLRFNAALVLGIKIKLIPVRCENEIKSTRKKGQTSFTAGCF